MAVFEQSTGEQRVYLGWYGWCPAGFGSSIRPTGSAETINLMNSQYESGQQLKWTDQSLFHTKLVKIVQVEATGKGFAYYDQLQRDQLENSLGSLGTEIFLQNTSFTQVEPGKAYLIVIRAASGAAGSTVASINIPHFYDTRYNQPDSTYRLTDECYSGGI
jgi:hypothetical protein